MRHGGKILSDQLVSLGVRRVFSVPGESFLAALDGLHDSGIDNIVCRHEGGAAMMAEAYGKMTGTPGVAFVTRGPGACNASAGVHVAMQDSTPMVLFVGQIARAHRDRDAFQEVDYRAMFGGMSKWVAEVDQTERLPEYIARAFRVAMSGRPGPVVLALPEDMLSAQSDVADARGQIAVPSTPGAEVFTEMVTALAEAERPMIVVGGPHWSESARRAAQALAEALGAPIVTGFRRQDRIDNRHPHFAGDLNVGINPKLAARMREADCLLLLGTRFGDIETQGYENPDPADYRQKILHVHPDEGEIGRVYGVDIGRACRADHAAEMLNGAAVAMGLARSVSDWTRAARADYDAWRVPRPSPGTVKLEDIVTALSRTLPEDAIITNGAGNYAGWVHRYFEFKRHGTQLAPTSGSMGYGFPAAISASLEHPDRVVVCFAGDGCFQMTLNEMSSAVQHGAHPIVIVVNNGRYGTIRMHQEKHYPGRVSGTDLANPDFAALAKAYGGFGAVVERTEDFESAFDAARASGTVSVIELKTDPRTLSTGADLG